DWAPASTFGSLAGAPSAPVLSTPTGTVIIEPAAGEPTVGNVLSEAFEIFKRNWVGLCLSFLLIFGISFMSGFILGIIGAIAKDRHGILGNSLGLIINGPLTLGMWTVVLCAVDGK